MTGRAFAVSMLTTALVAGIAGRCSAPAPRGLPAAVQASVTRHEVLTVQDTAAIRRLEAERAAARQREARAVAARRTSDSVAAVARDRADSLADVARLVQTAADSAAAWAAAYTARTDEAQLLAQSRDSAIAETRAVRVQLAAADSAAGVWQTHALRGDTVIAQLLPLAEAAGERCRILRVFGCPSRTAVAVASAIGVAGAVYVGRKLARGEIRIRLPIG